MYTLLRIHDLLLLTYTRTCVYKRCMNEWIKIAELENAVYNSRGTEKGICRRRAYNVNLKNGGRWDNKWLINRIWTLILFIPSFPRRLLERSPSRYLRHVDPTGELAKKSISTWKPKPACGFYRAHVRSARVSRRCGGKIIYDTRSTSVLQPR